MMPEVDLRIDVDKIIWGVKPVSLSRGYIVEHKILGKGKVVETKFYPVSYKKNTYCDVKIEYFDGGYELTHTPINEVMRDIRIIERKEEEETMKKKKYEFKVGDKVQIKDWDELVRENCVANDGDIINGLTKIYFTKTMKHLCGRTAIVEKISGNRIFLKDWSNDNGDLNWIYEIWMVKPINFKKGDIVKISKTITLDDLTKDYWHGCHMSTMDFLKVASFDDFNKEYKVAKKKISSLGENIIKIEGFNNFINDNLFELVERKEILDSTEKNYLAAVIRPFRNDVKSIVKENNYYDDSEYIYINYKNEATDTLLPDFKAGTMYKGMKLNKPYTLEELGL